MFNETRQRIISAYMTAGEAVPFTMRQVAVWAIEQGMWQPQRETMISTCAEELAEAAREDYLTDPQGRRVRAKHAARRKVDGVNLMLWDDYRTAPRDHMAISFQQRRQAIVGDCRQLKADVDSYNENYNEGKLIQLELDFTYDVAEAEVYTAANTSPPPAA
jgi:hypothetical protein